VSTTVLEFTLRAVDEASSKFEQVARNTESLGNRVQKGLMVGTGAVLAFDAAAIGIGDHLVKAGEGVEAADARIKNIVTSMGQFKGQTSEVADRIEKLAEKTALNTGIDAEQIKQTQAKLLTFKDLASSADKVGGSFDRATQAAIDMQAAGFGDASSNAVKLGRALNDPIKGITALTRVGVTFTAAQKEQIAALVAGGDKAGAQDLILKSLETRVGGTAAATATGSSKMAQGWKQVEESLGKALLPTFGKLVNFIDKNVLPAVKGFGDWAQKNPAIIQILVAAVAALTIGLVIATAVVWALNAAMFANPVTWIILAIVALIAIIVLLVMNWDSVVKFITKIWGGFIGWITDVLKGFMGWWRDLWKGAFGFVSDVWNGFVGWIKGVWNGFVGWIMDGLKAYVSFWQGVWKNVGDVFQNVWNGVSSFVKGVWNGIVGFVKGGVNGVLHAINGIIDGINGVAALGKAIGINIKLNHIPYLADGGVVTGPTLAMIGEAGPEAVIPLSRAKGQGLIGGPAAGGPVTVSLTVNGFVGSDQQIAQKFMHLLTNAARSGTPTTDLRHALGII